MLRIAIVGSCITRDLWPIRGSGASGLLYVSRSSFPSLFAPPVRHFAGAQSPPGDLHAHEHAALVADLTKTAVRRLVAFQPTHIIVDLIDERFDLLSVGEALITHSAELERSGYLGQPALQGARTIPRLSAACDRLWRDGVGRFAALVRGTHLRHAQTILHSARWAEAQRAPDGELTPVRDVQLLSGRPVEIAPYNALLERQEAVFEAVMSPLTRLESATQRLADPSHQWGLSPFHYTAEYYADVRRQLAGLGLAEAFSDRLAASSVPVG